MYRKIAKKSGKNRIWKCKFNVNPNEERKQKRNRWSNLQWGASRPPLMFPRLHFVFVLIYVEFEFPPPHPPPPSPGSKAQTKKNANTRSVAKWKFRSWRSILSKNRQNRSYPRGGKRPFKVSSKSTKKSIKREPPLVWSNEWRLKLEPPLVGTNEPIYKQVYLFICLPTVFYCLGPRLYRPLLP